MKYPGNSLALVDQKNQPFTLRSRLLSLNVCRKNKKEQVRNRNEEESRKDLKCGHRRLSPLSRIYESVFQIKEWNWGSPILSCQWLFSSEESKKGGAGDQVVLDGEFVPFDADNQIKMLNRNSMSNWMNIQSSVGLNCQLFDSNSRILNRIKDESVSEGFRFYPGPSEDHGQPTNPFSIENTINFADIDKQRFFSTSQRSPSPQKNQTPSPDTDNNRDWAAKDSFSRRGLKHLAALLITTLKKKRYSSHNEVAQEIEKHFMEHEPQENSHLPALSEALVREQKNIKRRIYDALNVMIAANVLEKELQVIQTKQSSSKNYTVKNICEEHHEEIIKRQTRIENKRELVLQMKAKRNALRQWIERKKRLREREKQKEKFQFPLIVMILQGSQEVRVEGEEGKLVVGFQRGSVYSQTDLLTELFSGQDVKFQEIEINNGDYSFLDTITYI